MSNKILFMSSAKLTAISLGVLLVVFCTIGMSFSPAEEGENVGNPNDSTYVTGPRRSHWNTGECGASDNNNNDYARTSVVTMGHGTVSIKNTTKKGSLTATTTQTSTNVAGNEAVISWNCNKRTDGHVNSFDLTATPDDGYYFAGWSTSNTSNTGTSSENPWNITVTIPHGEKVTAQNNEYESSSNPYRTVYYAYFGLITYVDVTFASVPEGCSYDITVGGSTQMVSTSNVVKTHIAEAKLSNPVAASGYVFAGWYQVDESGIVMDITSESPTVKFSENVTLGARFISTSTPKFKNITKDVEYYGLKMATMAASAGDKIIPVADCVVDGSDLVTGEAYTIPAGVILLIPFDASNTCYTTAPKEVAPAAGAPGPYRTLTLAAGVKINVEGSISVSAQQYSTNTTAGQHGVRGKYGFIYMNAGSEIVLKSGANFYAWGYISGDGEITAKDGSSVYEMFQITDFRGGNATSGIAGNSYGVFPFSQYYIQNIESALHLEYGATETVNASIYVSSSPYPGAAKLIGKSGALFTMSSGCVLTKKYDRITDRMHYSMNGNATLAPLNLKITGIPLLGTIDLNTEDYVLPLNGNMTINIAANKTLTVSQDLAVLPGSEVNIASGAKLVLSSGHKIYIYDSAEWKSMGYVYSSADIKQLAYVARNHTNVAGAPKTRTVDADPKFVVDGGVEATGTIYTTTSGADICSSGTGYFKFVTNNAPSGTATTYQVYQSGNSVSSWPSISVTSAQLHNADGSYTTTAGAPANTTVNYKHGHWGWKVIWRLEDGTELKRAYYYKQPDATWISNNKPAETHPDEGTSSCTYTFNGWNQETISAQQEIEITADFTKTCPNYYEVIWKSEDGSATLETDASVGEGEATHYNGEALTKATNWTTYTEYEFDGWATEENGAKVYDDGATPAATADVTYYAHFKSIGMAASVTVSGQEPEIYKTLPEAFDAAVTKPNCTIKILNDISGITSRLVYDRPNGICTLDLNNCTVHGACATLLEISAPGSIFTITDNSTEKNGRLENIFSLNEKLYNVKLSAGTLNFDAGTIYVKNTAQYHSSNLKSCEARGIQVTAEQKLYMTGGRVESYATRNAYGVLGTGSAANKTELNINGGSIYAEAPCGAVGINSSGKLNFGGTAEVEAHLNTDIVNAAYAADNADNNLNKHQTCYGINMTASANKTASSCYYGTLNVTGGTIKASSALSRNYNSTIFGVRVYYSVAGMENRNYASTSGTNAQQACAIGSVRNATIIVENKAKDTYGIAVYGHYNSYNKQNSVFTVENTSVDVKGYAGSYGIYSLGAIDGTTGECVTGDVEITNCTVNAETTTGATAYAAWVYAGATTIYQDKQANYYGEYAAAAKMKINGGTYTALSKTTSAYATGTATRAKSTYGTETIEETNRTLGGNAEAYPTLIINGGTFNATSTTTTARGVSSGGNTTINDATFNVVAGTTTAYGLYALSGKLTATNVIVNDTAKGRTSSSNNNAYAYGVLVDCGIPNGNTAQTGFAYAGDVELNNCTINAVTTTYDNARALYVNATNKVYNWTTFKADSLKGNGSGTPWSTATYNAYKSVFPCTLQGRDSVSYAIAGKATVNGGTFTAKAGRASAYGAVSTQTSVPANKEVTASPEMTLKNATFIAQTGSKTTAYGVQAGGPTLIEGCTITARAGNPTYQSTASGVRALDKTTTIKNSTITATATDAAYGLEGYVEINATHGYCWHGEFDLSEAGTTEVTAEAKTSGKKAWSVYLQATNKNIASGDFAGDYATAANAIINGGTYKAIASGSGSSAYSLSIAGKKTQGEVSAQPEVEVLDGFFNGATAEVGTAGVVGHMQLKGGYFVHNTNLATYAVAPKSVWTLPNTHEHYNPYYYKIAEHYNIVFMNGTTQLQQKDMEVGSIPAYTSTPTKDADAQYTYTFDGWSKTDGGDKLASLPAVSADATYFAHYSKTEKKYTVNVAAGANGSVSPSSVSNIGCETASGDITATPNPGYQFAGWTLPAGVTAADGYTLESNPIHIHATATGTMTATWTCASPTISSITSDENKWDFCAGETMTLTVNVSNIAADATYQWQKWNGSSWDNISGATSASYSTTMAAAKAGKYCCTVTNGSCSTTSAEVWVRVWQLHLGDDDIDFSANNAIVSLTSDAHYEFKLKDNTGGWFGLNDKTVTRTESAFALNGTGNNVNITAGMTGNYTFTIDYSAPTAPTITIAYPTADQPANRNIYFDKSVVEGWGNDLYYRIGNETWHKNNTKAGGTAWTLVPGTDNFYTTKTMAFDGFAAWAISNNSAWCADEWDNHSIYGNATDGYKITKAIDFQKYVVGENGVTIVPTVYHNTDENSCEYWNVSRTDGMLTHTATITTPSNGTITIAYTDVEGASQSRTATTAGLAHRCILTITAAPNPGYALSSLTVGGSAFTSGNTHILSADATIAATFEVADYGTPLDIVGATATSLTINATTLTLSKWPYTINGKSYGRDGKPGPDYQCAADRTITITHDKAADASFQIVVEDKNDEPVSIHNYVVPHVYTTNATLSGTDENSIVFVNSGKLTVNDEQYAKAIYVSEDAELNVKGTLHADKLVLRTVPFKAAILTNEGTIDAEHVYYSRKVADNSQFYLFGLPLSSTTSGVRLSDGSTPSSTSWQLKEYSESSRAANGISDETSNWSLISGEIKGGKGYEIYSGSKYYREYYFPVDLDDEADEITLSYTGNDPTNSGWNVVTSLRTGVQVNKPAPEGITISVLQPEGGYEQENPTAIKPAVPFSYQASSKGKLSFESDAVVFVKNDANPAPRRRIAAAEEQTRIQWIHLDVTNTDGVGDQTSIYSHPTRYEQAYKTGIDVAKQSLTASRAILYSSHAYGDMAFAGVADALLEQGVALTVYSPAAQELTISMRENDWLNRMAYVLLIDNETGMQVNLLNSDYTFDAAEGTTAGRFIIRGVFLAPQITTDLSGAGIDGERARKLMIDQKIYIEVNGRLYDATGKLVNK